MTMTVQEIGETLAGYCRTDQTARGLDELYADDAVSVEAFVPEGHARQIQGRDDIAGKHAWWNANFEAHSAAVEGPFWSGDDRFALIFEVDATDKASGQRQAMKEVGLYTVRSGKIVREEFLYSM